MPQGPGFWKFNNTLLNDPQYIDKIHYTYTRARKYYSHLTDRRLLWEMIKMEIRSATICYSKNKFKCNRNREQVLIRKLDQLDGTICNNFSSPDINDVLWEYDELKTASVNLRRKRKARKKRNYKKKTISEVRLQDDSTTNDGNVILNQIETYYKNLYTSDCTFSNEEYDSFMLNLKIPKLSDEDRDTLEGLLTYDECREVLETFQADKAPGEDGFYNRRQ